MANKKLSEVTEVAGVSDNDKVVIINGSSKEIMSTTIGNLRSSLLAEQSNDSWYGVTRKVGVAAPDMNRIGLMHNHRTLPYHSRIRPCIVRPDRTIAYYLDINDITKKEDGTNANLDGTDGVMCNYFPAGYILINSRGKDNGNNNETYAIGLSPFSVDGDIAERFPAFVVSLDYATIKRSTNQLMCVINDDADYAGSGAGATAGGLGYPRTSVSNYDFTARARSYGSGWVNSFAYFHQIITTLMYIEYGTYNLTKPFNSSLTADGYKQGGLGEGPQNWSSSEWDTYNSYNPIVKIGEVQKFLCGKNNGGTGIYTKSANSKSTPFPCWRWMSNLWGHLWQWHCGIDVDVQPGSGLSTCYMTKDTMSVLATNDNDFSFVDKYNKVGIVPRTTGYVGSFSRNSAIADSINGGSSSYCCAHFWAAIPSSRERRGLLFGARLNYGANALRASAASYDRPSFSYANIGSGLAAYVNE